MPGAARNWRALLDIYVQDPSSFLGSGGVTVFSYDFYKPDLVQYLQYIARPLMPDPIWHVDCHGCARVHVSVSDPWMYQLHP
jgi:hypothetical protein